MNNGKEKFHRGVFVGSSVALLCVMGTAKSYIVALQHVLNCADASPVELVTWRDEIAAAVPPILPENNSTPI